LAQDLRADVNRRSLDIDERIEGPESPYLATAISGLAGLHRDRGDVQDAVTLYERALAVLEGAVAQDDPARLKIVGDYEACLERVAN